MTLKTHRVDANGDWIIINGKFVFAYDLEAAAQIIASTMKTQLGEYRYNKTKGVEYFGNIFRGNPNFQRFEFEARAQVKALPFVEKITAFSYTLEDDVLSYEMTVKTIYGTATVNN